MDFKRYNNDRGATFIVVLAVFTFITALSLTILIMATSADTSLSQEYDIEQTEFFVSSIYGIMNEKFVAGEFDDALIDGETVEIDVTGFRDAKGAAVPLKMKVKRAGKRVNVTYEITYLGTVHEIIADYNISGTEESKVIVERGCYGLDIY